MKGRIDQHAKYRELIAARMDRPLTRVELRQLTSHLKTCAACQSVDAQYKSDRALLRGVAAPLPPRDLWARTSASLDREVGRSYRAIKWQRRVARGRRSAAQPSTSLMTAIAAIGVTAAIAVLQLAPAIGPQPSLASRPTPLAVSPQIVAWLGQGRDDVAVYRTEVSQVCPPAGPLDCVSNEQLTRTPINLPANMRAGNLALSPSGDQLALVGHLTNEDVIAVVMMPPDSTGSHNGSGHANPNSTDTGQGGGPADTKAPPPDADQTPTNVIGPAMTAGPDGNGAGGGSVDPNTNDQPTTPPASAIAGLEVLSILANVQSVGSPPDWSPNGSMLAFSAMPDDGSTGPDVYIWSPGEDQARAITTDHDSFFASWSGNRIVLSRLTGGQRPHTFVIDPKSEEERAVSGPQLWLPVVNVQRTQAIGWYGQLDTSGLLPAPRAGALYLMDWASVDPFAAGAPTPSSSPTSTSTPPTATPEATPTDTPEPTDIPPTTSPDHRPGADASATPDSGGGADATPGTDTTRHSAPNAAVGNLISQVVTDATPPTDVEPAVATPASDQPTQSPDNAQPVSVPDSLTALEPDRDPRAAPVLDWQARWSSDGEVLGVWIADSAGSTWGRLAVLAVDPTTDLVVQDSPLLSMTLARRGFSLGDSRVAWVGPSENNVDGELRIRTWGSDGFGGLRLKAPDDEEVVPAS